MFPEGVIAIKELDGVVVVPPLGLDDEVVAPLPEPDDVEVELPAGLVDGFALATPTGLVISIAPKLNSVFCTGALFAEIANIVT